MIKKLGQGFGLLVVSLFLFATPSYASILYFKPLGGDIAPNSVFPVQIRLNATAPESITSTSVYFTYPQEKLEISYVKPGSSFPLNLGNTYNNGIFAMTRNNSNGVSGDVVVATVGFKPKVANTSVSLNFVDGIKAAQADNVDTLDATWTKANIAQYNIKEGKINSVAQAGVDQLPVAGIEDQTYLLFGIGGGLICLSGLGFFGGRKLRVNRSQVS